MSRFLHTVDKIIIMDGDDVRRAPMAAAILQDFASHHPVFRLWQTRIESGGVGETIKEGASPDAKAKSAMFAKGLDISSHRAKIITLTDIAKANIVLAVAPKHMTYLQENICKEYPSLHSRVVLLLDYVDSPLKKFPSLIGASQSQFQQFAEQVASLLPTISKKLLADVYSPLLIKGTGLSSTQATGRVRVVNNSDDAYKIEKGEIVICHTNHLKVFYERCAEAAGAIVTTSGSESFELSQIGHELGIPCVCEASYAMEILHTGEMVLVDGASGAVYGYPSPRLTLGDLKKKYGLNSQGK